MKIAVFVLALFMITLPSFAAEGDDLIGLYWSEGKKGIIEIFREGDEYKGEIAWQREPKKDTNNPDPALRDRDQKGIVFLDGFTYDPASQKWTGGEVYAPDNGKTYSGKIWLEDEGTIMKMRGFVGISLLGRTAEFVRVGKDEELPK